MLNWDSIGKEYEELTQKLTSSFLDQKTRVDLQKKASRLSELLTANKEIVSLEERIAENKTLLEQEDFRELAEEEIVELEKELTMARSSLDDLLYPADARDKKSVFLEIRAGAGGQEAALFVSDLFKMYSNYALARHWDVSIVDTSSTDIGGYKELIVYIKGKNVYKNLKFESGVHRVQRVPQTEGSGRIHTSTVTVAVLPEVDDVAIDINPQDLRIDTYRAQGAGGQHVNTTDSAIRIVHIPTGLVVTCQDERSQLKNKNRAMKVLKARLFEMEEQKKADELSAQRKQQIGSGGRSEKVRTYNYPQNRVTDHRTNLTLKKLDVVMQGNIDELLKPLLEWDLSERKKQELV